MATTTQAFARRNTGSDGQPITFISADRADNQPMGWQRGWFEDGHVFEGCTLTHVMEPSWRVSSPVEVEAELEERSWVERREFAA